MAAEEGDWLYLDTNNSLSIPGQDGDWLYLDTDNVGPIIPDPVGTGEVVPWPTVFDPVAMGAAVAYLYENIGFNFVHDEAAEAYAYENVGASLHGRVIVGEFRGGHLARGTREAAAEIYENVTP